MAIETLDIRVRQQGARTVARDIRNIGLSASAVTGQLSTTQRVLRGLAIASVSRRIAAFADGFTNLRNRVRLYSKSQEEANATTSELISIANRTRVGLDSVSLTFQRLSIVQERLGLTTARVTRLVELLSKAVVLGGSNAQEAGGALRQFSQGLASNFKAAAQELNSVLEQTPGLAAALAAGLGISTDQIKKFAEEGKLTSDLAVRAIEAQGAAIDAQFAKIAPTIGQAFTVLENSMTVFVGRIFQATGAGKAFTDTVIKFSQALIRLSIDTDKLNQVLEATGTILGVLVIKAVASRFLFLGAAMDFIINLALPSVLNAIVIAIGGIVLAAGRAGNAFLTLGLRATTALASINVAAFTARVSSGFDAIVAAGSTAFATLGRSIDAVGTVLKNLPFILASVAQRFTATGVAAASAFRRGLGGAIDNVGTVMKNLGLIVVATGAKFKAMGVAALGAFRKITVASTIGALKRLVVAIAGAGTAFVVMGAKGALALRSPARAIRGMASFLSGGFLKAVRGARIAMLALAATNPFTLILVAAAAFLALLFGVRNETVEVGGQAVKIKDFFVAAFNLARDALLKFSDTFLGFFGQNGDGVSTIRGFFNVFIGLYAATFKAGVLFVTRLGDVFKGIGAGIVAAVRSLPGALAAIATGDFKGAGALVAGAFGTGFEEASGGFGAAVAEIFKTELAKDQLQAITDLIAAKFPELTAEAVRLAAARELAKKKADELAEAQGRVAAGAAGLAGVLTKEQKALAGILAKMDAASEVALEFQKTQDKLNAAFIKGIITQEESADILERLGKQSFRELAAETDKLATATIEFNITQAKLNALARAGKIDAVELASAQQRLRKEYTDTTLEIEAQNDTLSTIDAITKGAQDGFERFRDGLGSTFSNVSDLISGSFEKGFDALSEFTRTGTLDFKRFTLDILVEIQKITLKLLALQAIRAFETQEQGGFLKQFFGKRLEKTGAPEGTARTEDVGVQPSGFGAILRQLLGGERPELTSKQLAEQAARAGPTGAPNDPISVQILADTPGLAQLNELTGERELEMQATMLEADKASRTEMKSIFERITGFFGELPGKIGGFFSSLIPSGITEPLKAGFTAVTGFLGFGNDKNEQGLGLLNETNKSGFGDLLSNLGQAVGGIAGTLGGLFGGGGGAGDGAGGILSIVSSLAGLFGGGLAGGGLIGPNQLGQSFLVGERGTELFQPSQTGEVISNEALTSAMGGAQPEINVNITNVDDPKSIPEAISTREGEQAVMNIIQRNQGRLKEILT